MKTEKCNGWTNYATWRVNLEIIDGLEFDVDGEKVTADHCKDYAEMIVDNGSTEGFALDYALAFLQEVNWQEIASSVNEKLELNR